MRTAVLLGIGLSLVLLAYTLSMTMFVVPSNVAIEPLADAKLEDGKIVVEASKEKPVAIVENKKPVIVVVGSLRQISIISPAYLRAESLDDKGVVGPASTIVLPVGRWKLYIVPMVPGQYTIEIRG